MTYSIVAYDATTQQLGVGVQTHQPSVGAGVPWVKAGVGAIATQSVTNRSFGPLGLELLSGDLSAEQTLAALLASDPDAALRQVAVVDREGRVAAHTGARCIPFAGHRLGNGYSVQANMMLRDTVPDAMAAAFEAAQGSLMERLLVALEAAEAEGGDIRGAQSAALLVLSSNPGPDWHNVVCDLRVDDHVTPLAELRRLVEQRLADRLSDEGEEQARRGEIEVAIATFAEARARSHDPSELQFWQAMILADECQRFDEARKLLRDLVSREPQWRELVGRLVPAQLIKPETAERLLAEEGS
ncbi:MAG TPA: DUF1028 domain-containing protein [Herpetosiphonaceae bacterium]